MTLLRKLCRSAALASLSRNGLALYLRLLVDARTRSLTGTLPKAHLGRQLARSRSAIERGIHELERFGLVARDPRAPAPVLRYRILPSGRWRPGT